MLPTIAGVMALLLVTLIVLCLQPHGVPPSKPAPANESLTAPTESSSPGAGFALSPRGGTLAADDSSEAPGSQAAESTSPPSSSQSSEYTRIDAYALATPEGAATTIPTLAAYLTKPARNDAEKARTIFRWITHHLAYDEDGVARGKWEQRPEVVLKLRCTDCGGHSQLFQKLAEAAGLDATVITGETRDLDHGPNAPFAVGEHYQTHAWNAVRIYGQWRLLDCTWAGEHAKTNGQIRAAHAFNPFYFFPAPEQLVYTHLPDDPRWQLLDHPVTQSEQDARPALWGDYFEYSLKVLGLGTGSIRVDNRLVERVSAPADISLIAEVRQNGQVVPGQLTFLQRVGNVYDIYALFPQAGKYVLRLNVRRGSHNGNYEHAIDFPIEATLPQPGSEALPQAFDAFYDHYSRVNAPASGLLSAGSPQPFQVHVPGATRVAVETGGQFVDIPRQQGDLFAGEVALAPGEVLLTAEFPPKENFHEGLIRYTAQ